MRDIIDRAVYFIEFQALSEILAKYYDGSFAKLVQEYIRTSGMSEEEREASVEVVRRTFTIKNVKRKFN